MERRRERNNESPYCGIDADGDERILRRARTKRGKKCLEASEFICMGLCVGEKEGLRARLYGLGTTSTDLASFAIGNRCEGYMHGTDLIINVRWYEVS